MKYKIHITTSVIVEADNGANAILELEAMRTASREGYRLASDEERDLLLNATIEDVSEVEPFEE
jgi:hypothetical protein